MTTSQLAHPLLTADDTARITGAISASHAKTTRTVYASAWRAWERWCVGRGLDPLGGSGAEAAVVCAYLAERAAHGASAATIDLACSAIRYHHRRHGLPDPIQSDAVRQVRRGLHRILGAAPR